MAAKIISDANWIWSRGAAVVVGLVLFAAALAKIFWPAAKTSVFGSVAHAAPWLGWSIIATEALLGIWLISGWRGPLAANSALVVFAIFSGIVLHDMFQHHPQPCGCFGQAWQQSHEPAVIERNLGTAK